MVQSFWKGAAAPPHTLPSTVTDTMLTDPSGVISQKILILTAMRILL